MADPIALIVLVALGEGESPTTRAMVRASREALGDAHVQVLESAALPDEADAPTLERAAHANAVVEVTSDATHLHVTLRVHLARSGRWIERGFVFGPSDAPSELGRTLGFAVASMLPEREQSDAHAPGDPTPEPPARESAATDGGAPPSPPRDIVAPPAGVPAVTGFSTPAVEKPATGRSQRSVLALEFVGGGATGALGGPGAGGAIAWFPFSKVGVRIGAAVRAGNVDSAQASSLAAIGSAGVLFDPWLTSPERPFGLTVRADYLLLRESLTHFDGDELTAVTQARWLSGVAALVQVEWRLTDDVGVLAGPGVEYDFGETEVDNKGARVATIPSLRFLVEGGLRIKL